MGCKAAEIISIENILKYFAMNVGNQRRAIRGRLRDQIRGFI